MNARRAAFFLLVMMAVAPIAPVHAAEQGYWSRLGSVFARGLKNVVSAPWEVPVTIQKHDREDNGNPRAYRDVAGFFDGSLRALTRFGCGAWDILWCVVPGSQDGLTPLQPETFF